jgi:hypothetical protein
LSFVRAEAALDCLDRPAREVGLRNLEKLPIRWLEFVGDIKILCHDLVLLLYRAVNMVHCFFINTPLT